MFKIKIKILKVGNNTIDLKFYEIKNFMWFLTS